MKRAPRLLFRDYLKGLPPDAIFEHLVEGGGQRRRIVSTGLVEELARDFTSPTSLAQRLDALDEKARRACAMAYLLGSSGLVAHGLDSVYRELLESFLVFAARDDSDARHLIGFDDLAGPLRPLLAPLLIQRVAGDTIEPPAPPVRHRALNDFVVVAVAALNGWLRKNRNGNLGKGCLGMLSKQLSVRRGRKQPHPLCDHTRAVSLLVEYGLSRGVLADSPRGYTTTRRRIASWLSCPLIDLYHDLLDFVIDYTGGWRVSYLEAMQREAGEDWLCTERFLPTCLQPAATAFGYLDYTRMVDAVGRDAFVTWRMLPPAEAMETPSRAVTVMPDFTVVVARETSPGELFAFSWLGTLSSFDQIYKGTIERECVNDALSRGVKAGELLELLERWQAPHNIVATVEEWIRAYSRLCVRDGGFIVSYDEKATRQIMSYQPIRAMVEPLNAHAVFAIGEGMGERAWQVLSDMGYDPRFAEAAAGEERRRETAPAAAEGLEPLFELDIPSDDDVSQVKGGKYSAELKPLDLNEMLHVIDYAILMGYVLRFEYAGSPHVRRGRYAVKPLSVEKGTTISLEGVMATTKRSKKFFVRKIEKIGVVTQ